MTRTASTRKILDVQTKYGLFAIWLKRDGSGYAVTVPRLPEIATFGKNLAESKHMAEEAIEVAIEGEVLARAEKRGTITFSRAARKVFA